MTPGLWRAGPEGRPKWGIPREGRCDCTAPGGTRVLGRVERSDGGTSDFLGKVGSPVADGGRRVFCCPRILGGRMLWLARVGRVLG